jgi:hypothetical protein
LVFDHVKVARVCGVDVNQFAKKCTRVGVFDGEPDKVGNKEASLLYGQILARGKDLGVTKRVGSLFAFNAFQIHQHELLENRCVQNATGGIFFIFAKPNSVKRRQNLRRITPAFEFDSSAKAVGIYNLARGQIFLFHKEERFLSS